MEQVTQTEVVTEWLEIEQRRPHTDRSVVVDELSPMERLDRLSELTSMNWVFEEKERVWYRTELTEDVLFVAQHPWGAYGFPDGSIMDISRTLDGDPPGPEWKKAVTANRKIADGVVEKAESLPESAEGPLVFACRLTDPPFVVDGNHRAIAIGLHLLRTGEFVSTDVYLGFETYTRFTDVAGQLQAALYRLQYV